MVAEAGVGFGLRDNPGIGALSFICG